jgi:hypothetical protein
MTEVESSDQPIAIKFSSVREKEFLSVLLNDLCLSGWTGEFSEKKLEIKKKAENEPEGKDKIREVHRQYRTIQLHDPAVRRFITELNKVKYFNGKKVSIKNVICDGQSLIDRINKADETKKFYKLPIQPYIQEASSSEKCPFTGIILSDMWRYFRHTWSTEYRSIPGRKINLIIRDAAAEDHPVIGILALTSPVLNLNVRDEALGLSLKKIEEHFRALPTIRASEELESVLKKALDDIFINDLLENQIISMADLNYPNDQVIKKLEKDSRELSDQHGRMMNNDNREFQEAIDLDPVEINNPKKLYEACISPLFKGKRIKFLSLILRAKKFIQPFLGDLQSLSELLQRPSQEMIREVFSLILLKTKNDRLASNILDLSVCGAIAPYSNLVGGKLVSLLAGSPEVQKIYEKNYGSSPSIIASIMANRPVYKSTRLLGITTTSLYSTGSSQYNRIKVPRGTIDIFNPASKDSLEYKNIGTSEGYGTFQFSGKMLKATSEFLAGDDQTNKTRSNSIFGEGSSPRMRKIREVLDRFKIPADKILKHTYKRIVYLYSLVDDIQKEMLKTEILPIFILDQNKGKEVTEKISEFWYSRYAEKRIQKPEIRQKISENSFKSHGSHCAYVELPETDDEK